MGGRPSAVEILNVLRSSGGRRGVTYAFGDEDRDRMAEAFERALATDGRDAALDALERDLPPFRREPI